MDKKFLAHWISASSIATFKNCQRAYYLQNVYKENKCKIVLVSPYTSMGSCIHSVLEPLAELPSNERAVKMLAPDFYKEWEKYKGELGGFKDESEENEFKERAKNILRNVKKNIHHLLGETAFLLPNHSELPWMWLSEKEEIIISGNTDFILKTTPKSYKVLDFKTGKGPEKADSLQLPIYRILLNHFLGPSDFTAAYWYLGEESPTEKEIPQLKESIDLVMDIGLQMKEVRIKGKIDTSVYKCARGGCFSCEPLEKIIRGEAKFIGKGRFNSNLYVIPNENTN